MPSAGDRVALKRVSEDPHNPGTGMRVDALREIKLLQELHHKNVVPLLDVYKRDQAVELVFPFAPRDLKQVRRSLARAGCTTHYGCDDPTHSFRLATIRAPPIC